jgi:transcriptional regulator with XRE-family HTH domain
VDDQRVGAGFRAVRHRRRWRQQDVAQKAGVSVSLISLVERGHLDRVSLRVLRRVSAALDIRIEVMARWRGGELERLLNARHSALQGAVARWLGGIPGWAIAPEVSFNIWGERGSVDLLAWHAPSTTLLVIEVKTEIVDVGELIEVIDRKVRLAPEIARGRGWRPLHVAAWIVLAEGPTNRRRLAQHGAVLRAAFPGDGRQMRHWLRQPTPPHEGRVAALSFFSDSTGRGVSRGSAPVKRVRVPQRTTVEREQAPDCPSRQRIGCLLDIAPPGVESE